jgi:hypothetical protein
MSEPSLPPEMLDLVLDHLYGQRATLKACCAVSKSWVPRARRNLFFDIEFPSESSIKLWMKTFPDPSTSPAHYTRILTLHGLSAVAAAGTHACAWVRAFRHIVDFRMFSVQWNDSRVSLFPKRGFSPTLKSLYLSRSCIPPSEILNFICSFPLLKDLKLFFLSAWHGTVTGEWSAPSTSPELTGPLHVSGETRPTVPRFLDPLNCFRFFQGHNNVGRR